MGSVTVDSSAWPLVRVTYVGSVDDARFEEYVREQAALLERRKPYVILFDASESGIPSARQRQRMAEYAREHEAELRRYCKRRRLRDPKLGRSRRADGDPVAAAASISP